MLSLIVLALSGCHGGIVDRYDGLRDLTEVGGEMVGSSGTPGEFYKLAQKIMWDEEHKERSEVRDMLTHANPVVRAMGIVCLARYLPEAEADTKAVYPEAVADIKAMYDDQGVISVMSMGCMRYTMTVGSFAEEIVDSSEFRYCFISQRNRAILRFYRVKVDDGNVLIERIKKAIAPGTWYEWWNETDDGLSDEPTGPKEAPEPEEATKPDVNPHYLIWYRSKCLIVCHTPDVHAQVIQFLKPWQRGALTPDSD
ncbi:MAG: hypothetical protein ABIF82_02605 [Planctomycetota bacterium]